MSRTDDAWLLVIDPQKIFADPTSDWASPMFPGIVEPIHRLAKKFRGRTIVTRWLPGDNRGGSWTEYFQEFSFADVPNSDPLFDLVPEATDLTDRPTLDVSTFGKFGRQLTEITGDYPHLVLTGVSTDCCVISTALAAADAGARLTVVSDACAGSTPENHEAALKVMSLYQPQLKVVTAAELLHSY